MKFTNSCDGIYKDSLDVRFTKACDNRCPFCIEKNGLCAQNIDVDKMIESTIKSGKKDILILGGEPLLELDKLLLYVYGIRKHVNHIYITTSLPKTIIENMSKFRLIMKYVDGLNVSLQHWEWHWNNEVLHATSKHNRIALLKSLCFSYADKIRVSINLVEGEVDYKFEVMRFLNTMREIGVKHVKINELQNADDLYVNFEKIYGIKLKSPYSHGCQQDIVLEGYEDMRITLKRACFCVNNSLQANLSDFAKVLIKKAMKRRYASNQLVMYENGMLHDGWITNDK